MRFEDYKWSIYEFYYHPFKEGGATINRKISIHFSNIAIIGNQLLKRKDDSMYIAIYTRTARGTISDSQIDECMLNAQKLAKKMGYIKRKIKVFKDEGYSGMDIKNRPELTRLRSEVGDALVSHVIVPDYARLSRNLDDIQTIFQDFENHGVEFMVCN